MQLSFSTFSQAAGGAATAAAAAEAAAAFPAGAGLFEPALLAACPSRPRSSTRSSGSSWQDLPSRISGSSTLQASCLSGRAHPSSGSGKARHSNGIRRRRSSMRSSGRSRCHVFRACRRLASRLLSTQQMREMSWQMWPLAHLSRLAASRCGGQVVAWAAEGRTQLAWQRWFVPCRVHLSPRSSRSSLYSNQQCSRQGSSGRSSATWRHLRRSKCSPLSSRSRGQPSRLSRQLPGQVMVM